MGLDAYIRASDDTFHNSSEDPGAIVPASRVIDENGDYYDGFSIDVIYFRKFHDLHDYLADIYYSRGGTKSFNCVYLQLYEHDLINLIDELIDGCLSGEWIVYKSNLLAAIHHSMRLIKDGYTVYYDSWW